MASSLNRLACCFFCFFSSALLVQLFLLRPSPPPRGPLTASPSSPAAAPAAVLAPSSTPRGGCQADIIGASVDWGPPSAPASPRYLLYAPQFGHSNQLVALRNAAAWASILNRTLVLPHLTSHTGGKPLAAFGAAFDVAGGAAAALPLSLLELDDYKRFGLPPPARHLVLDTNTRFAVADDAYLAAVGLAAPPLYVPLRTFSVAAIADAFGGCRQTTLSFRSLFAAFDHKPLSASPPGWSVGGRPGLDWLDRALLPALLAPAPPLLALVDAIELAVLQKAGGSEADTAAAVAAAAPSLENIEDPRCKDDNPSCAAWAVDGQCKSNPKYMLVSCARACGACTPTVAVAPGVQLACAHLRRGDFVEECQKYDDEAKSGAARGWVLSHLRGGWSCLQTPAEAALNLIDLQTKARPATLAIYAAVEEPAALRAPELANLSLSSLADHSALVDAADLGMPADLAATLLDQLVCARARTLLLNIYSTFSQLVMSQIGMRRGGLGFVRDLDPTQQRVAGVRLTYWRRPNPFAPEKLLAGAS